LTGRAMNRQWKYNSALLLAALACVAVLSACGCGESAPEAPREILRKGIFAQENLKSVHMKMTSEADFDLPGARQSSVTIYEGDFEQPDRWKLTIRSRGTTTDVVLIGERAFVKYSGNDTWSEKTGVDFFREGTGPGDVAGSAYLESAGEVSMVESEGDTYHLAFDLDMARYIEEFQPPGADFSGLETHNAGVDVWILKDDYFIEKTVIDFVGGLTEENPKSIAVSIEVEFSEFGRPVSIEQPM